MALERKTIAAALNGVMGRDARKPVQQIPDNAGGYVPKSRVGKKALLTHHDPAVLVQLKQLALEYDTSQQKLLSEALNLLFIKYGKPPVA